MGPSAMRTRGVVARAARALRALVDAALRRPAVAPRTALRRADAALRWLRVIAARAAASAGLRPVERFVAFGAFTGTAWVTVTVRLARALPSVMVSSNVNLVRVRTSGSTA